ncbi:malic enzyme, NAD binding domain protein [Dictyocaulus viviparus]|uniref:Malic enzyme n=1 Tax=Dictyocaulus viviparus TaxID=29172 RepID=A0A0D8XGQ2_DICVI|nr:malic enzyme, NAD binding domain protein [Dictyocaulus viviparus]
MKAATNVVPILYTSSNHHFGRRLISSSCSLSAKEVDLNDPKQMALYKLYRPERVTPREKGYDLLKNPRLNKGMAFSLYERHYLGIHGLLPPAFMTEEQQAYRVMKKLREQPDNLAKYIQLDELQGRTEKLFYRVLCDNVKELMPIVYTPTVGLACQKFGAIYRHPKGLYVTINDNSISKIYQILCNWPVSDVQAIVVTDGERILGLGDLGAYGMGIPVGKLALYVALAGIQPHWGLPVVIDVGTDNQKLLDDPFYIGLRRRRVRGPEYELLLDNFMKAATKRFGRDTLIQFEDFAFENAYTLLDRYKNDYCVFNDDIQGTASVVVAGLLATTRITGQKLSQQKLVFFGAGEAGLGVAEMCVLQMIDEGLTEVEACDRIYMMDIDGLITNSRHRSLTDRHIRFAKDMTETKNLLEVIHTVKPQAIIGASTVHGAFTEEIIREMTKINRRPIIFALSNPTNKAECTAEDAYRFSNGTVLFASGSPFEDVHYDGKIFKPGQGNNSYIFPGVALSAIVFKAKHIPDTAFLLAARRCAQFVSVKSLEKYSRLYPRLKDIRELSVQIAIDIGNYFYENNLATLHPEPEDKEMYIRSQLYSVEYDELINKTYDWPPRDCKHGFPVPVLPRSSMDDE